MIVETSVHTGTLPSVAELARWCDEAMSQSAEDCPLLAAKDHAADSLFEPANLLREARRQKGLPDLPVPAVALLDPDGDIVRHLAATGRGRLHPG